MPFDVDFSIVVGFLLLNLGVGLYYGRGVKTINDFALGGRNFSTVTMVATIVATWISGSIFTVSLTQSYKQGVYFIPSTIGHCINLLIVAWIFAPKMYKFLGNLSVAETMGSLYGKEVRIISAIASIAKCIGSIALQIKVFSTIFDYFLGIDAVYATVLSSCIVITYSAFGGIKSVAFTDVLQFCTFSILIPIFCIFVWKIYGNMESLQNTIFNMPQIREPPSKSLLIQSSFVSLFFLIPSLNPAMFQRTLMGKNIQQIKTAFTISAFLSIFVMLLACFIGLLILSNRPDLNPNKIFVFIIDQYSFTGLKGLLLVGIIAMIMSTADSWINSASVLFAHDICKPLNINIKSELTLSRTFSIIVGLCSLVLVFATQDLFKLILLQANFYMPIVTGPLMLGILGFKSTKKSALVGIFTGILTVILWKIYIQEALQIDSVIPAMVVNIFCLLTTHYLLGEPGGWIKTVTLNTNQRQKKSYKKLLVNFLVQFQNFNLLNYCNRYLPSNSAVYNYFSVAAFLTIISTISIEKELYYRSLFIINFFQALILASVTFFMFSDLWIEKVKDKYIGVIWYLSVFVGLIFISSFLVLMSKFSHVSLIILTIHLSLVSLLMGWRAALVMIVIGLWLSFSLYENYIGELVSGELYDLKLKLLYVLLIVGSFSITLLKSKEEDLEEIEERAEYFERETDSLKKEIEYSKREFDNFSQGLKTLEEQFEGKEGVLKEKEIYLKDQLKIRNIEISKLKNLKDEFIRNVEHESNTPLTGILSLCDILHSYYDKLDKRNIKQSIKDIVNSGDRLKTYVNNIADLSKLSSLSYELNKEKINLSKLIKERTVLYKKIFADDTKKQKFKFEIEKNIIVECDEYYITQAIDNLISNAVKYGEGNPITIILSKTNDNEIQFKIIDSGIGIPENELISIFDKFTVSSKTKSSAEGRGIGLALCEKIIKVHNGRIWAKQNSDKGVTFVFTLFA